MTLETDYQFNPETLENVLFVSFMEEDGTRYYTGKFSVTDHAGFSLQNPGKYLKLESCTGDRTQLDAMLGLIIDNFTDSLIWMNWQTKYIPGFDFARDLGFTNVHRELESMKM